MFFKRRIPFALSLCAATTLFAQIQDDERARQMLAAGQPASAAEVYRRLAEARPNDADLLVNLAIAEYTAGQFASAARSAAAALKLSPAAPAASLFLGASYLELGDYAQAVSPLQNAVASNPGDRNGQLMLAESLLGSGDTAGAVKHFLVVVGMLPKAARAWAGLARSYESSGQKQAAAEAWDKVLALPPSVQSHVHKAELHAAALRWRQAESEWKAALQVAPKNLSVRIGLASALLHIRDYESALQVLEPAIAAQNSQAEFLYGACLLNMQRLAESIPHLKAALVHDAAMLPARAALGQALLQTGKPEEAVPLLESSLPSDQDGSTHFQLFRAYQLLRRDADAERALSAYHQLKSRAN